MWFWRRKSDAVGPETFRDWLSEEEWLAALEQVRKRPIDLNGPERRDARAPRHEAIRRCLLRIERPHRGEVLGMLLVRTRNISNTGLCVLHGGRVPRHSRATVVLETTGQGQGIIAEGEVVWCRPVRGSRPRAHEIGIRFDEPIDASPFAPREASAISDEYAA